MKRQNAVAALFLVMTSSGLSLHAAPKPISKGYWPVERSQAILDKTETTLLSPDLSVLTPEEKIAVGHLLAVGQIMQQLYEESRHHQALTAKAALEKLHVSAGRPGWSANLLELYRLNHGPIAMTLDNQREAFLPVDPQKPGRNVYPIGITKEEIESFLAAHPEDREQLLAERSIVRRAGAADLQEDLGRLRKYPAISLLHPGLADQLARYARKPDAKQLYAIPYSLAYAGKLTEAHRLLNLAADSVGKKDPEFARYLRNRARDLLTNDYESGDAAWVTGRFGNLNAQIGAYETYDDALYGAKAFHSFSLLLLNGPATAELRKAIGGLQALEDSLPYERKKRIREDIPVGIYQVIADFGQARGANTASILPNDALFARRYGRTILLRENIMKHPAIFANSERGWKAVVDSSAAGDLVPDGDFYRTLWHEVGHYLGADSDRQGRDLAIALEDYADALEEMKADLVSLYAAPQLKARGYYDDSKLRAIHASGIRRTLQNNRPRADQPYNRMQLVQFNYFLEQGLISFDKTAGKLRIHYDKYPEAVSSLLRRVLEIQDRGDKAAAAELFERYGSWTTDVHDVIAKKIRDAQGPRFRLMRYAALGE